MIVDKQCRNISSFDFFIKTNVWIWKCRSRSFNDQTTDISFEQTFQINRLIIQAVLRYRNLNSISFFCQRSFNPVVYPRKQIIRIIAQKKTYLWSFSIYSTAVIRNIGSASPHTGNQTFFLQLPQCSPYRLPGISKLLLKACL